MHRKKLRIGHGGGDGGSRGVERASSGGAHRNSPPLDHEVLWDGLWVPLRYRRIMSKQGVKSVPFRFLVGQLPEQKRFQESLGDVVPVDSFADFSPTVVPQYALFFPKFPGAQTLRAQAFRFSAPTS